MTSTSSRGQGQIRLEFETGVDIQRALREVNQLIREVPSYPPNVLEPVIADEDPESNDYIAWFVVEIGHEPGVAPAVDVQTLFDFVDNRVRPRFERVDGISQVNVLGGRQRQLRVRVDPEKLAQRGITMSQLVNIIQADNRDVSAGAINEGQYDVAVRVPGRWDSPREAANTILRQDEDGTVYLSDVAVVYEGYSERDSFIRSRGEEVLALNFQRELGSNVIAVMNRLQNEVAAVNAEGGLFDQYAQLNGLPAETIQLRQVYDTTSYVEQAISMVRTNLLIGAGIAVVVLLLFLRSLRSVGIIALAIPTSVLGVAIAMVSLGRTVNIVSLAGAAFSVGLVVDNAIVVLENIYRHLGMGKTPARAAYEGAKEVSLAVLSSTLTTVVVFIPVLLIEQQVGQLFRDIAIAISAAVLISYVVSILVIPSAAAILLRQHDGGGKGAEIDPGPTGKLAEFRGKVKRVFAPVGRAFGTVPTAIAATVHFVNGSWLLRGGIVASAMLLVAVGIYFLLPPFDYLPKGNRNIVFGLVAPPPGYNVDQMDRLASNVEAKARPYFEAGVRVMEGEQSLEAAAESVPPIPTGPGDAVRPPPVENYFIVGLAAQDIIFHGAISLDDRRVVDLLPLFNTATADGAVPGAFGFGFQPPIFRLGGGSGAAVKIDLTGEDLDQVTGGAGALFGALFGAFENRAQIQPNPIAFNLQGPELQFRIDEQRASDVGLTTSDIGLAVQANGDGILLQDAYKYPDELRDVAIVTRAADAGGAIGDLSTVSIATPLGRTVSLGDVTTPARTSAPTTILRVGGERAVTLEVTAPEGMPLATAVETIEETVAGLRQGGAIPPTVNTDIAGTADALTEIRATLLGDGTILGTLSSSAVLALICVYLLMCVLFQSFSYPLVIMITVPLATFGGFLGLFMVNWWSMSDPYLPVTNLDVLAMLGFILLTGTVVNNAILVVEQTLNFLRMSGDELDEACIDCRGEKTDEGLEPRRAITEATRSRVRPIFMSMFTSVGGMLPLVLIPGSGTELYRGLGAVVVGGLAVSTLFTLFVTPALLSIVVDIKQMLGLRIATKNADRTGPPPRREIIPEANYANVSSNGSAGLGVQS
jgi:HAE1 family hydrophobic/amphiphilic exporter-1